MNNNLSANAQNTTTTTQTDANGVKTHTAVLNTPPAPAAVSIADRLKAKLNKGTKTQTDKANPITPKVMFETLEQPGTVTAFIDAALNGDDKQPLVITASHVNRSECLKAAHAAIKFADLAAKYAPIYGLTAPEFTRLLAKLVIQDYNPAALEAETETATEAPATAQAETIPPAPAENPLTSEQAATSPETTPTATGQTAATEPPPTFTLEATPAKNGKGKSKA